MLTNCSGSFPWLGKGGSIAGSVAAGGGHAQAHADLDRPCRSCRSGRHRRYVSFLSSPPDPAETAERIDLCERIVLAALDSPPSYRRLSALEMRQLVIPRMIAISFRTDDIAQSPANLDVAVCIFANPFNSMYGRPGMIKATVRGRPVAQDLVDAVAAKWAASRP